MKSCSSICSPLLFVASKASFIFASEKRLILISSVFTTGGVSSSLLVMLFKAGLVYRRDP